MSSNWGENFKISIFGESHGEAIGVIIDGLPSGILLDWNKINRMLERRAPGRNKYSTARKEPDKIQVLSGVYNDRTTGTPLTGIIFNQDTRSKDYKDIPVRPSHADYSGMIRYDGYNDPRGGGHFSGRLTAPLVFAGAVAKQMLETKEIFIGGVIKSIYTVKDNPPKSITAELLTQVSEKDFPVFDDVQGNLMGEEIDKARKELDSVGGVISAYALGLPAGIGSPMFDGLENKISSIVFGIPAVRGIEFGTGFDATLLKGSQHNDSYYIDEDGEVKTSTNHHGGILGGISTGMPVSLNVGIKPTPSISVEQNTITNDLSKNTTLQIKGRHDPCIVQRAVPCVEAAVACAVLDSMLEGGNPNVSW